MCSWMVSSSSSRRMTSAGAVLAIGALACSRSVGSYPPAARCGCAAAPNRMLSLRYAGLHSASRPGSAGSSSSSSMAKWRRRKPASSACWWSRENAARAAEDHRRASGPVSTIVTTPRDAPSASTVRRAASATWTAGGRRPRRVVLVPGAGTVEAAVAQHDAARVEHRALVLLDGGLALAARRERDALGEDAPDLRRPRRREQVARALAADTAVRRRLGGEVAR